MYQIIVTCVLMFAMGVVAYCIKVSGERNPETSVYISGNKIYNDHRLQKTLNKTTLRTLQKPTVSTHHLGSGGYGRRSSTSSSETSSKCSKPTSMGDPITSSAGSRSSKCWFIKRIRIRKWWYSKSDIKVLLKQIKWNQETDKGTKEWTIRLSSTRYWTVIRLNKFMKGIWNHCSINCN